VRRGKNKNKKSKIKNKKSKTQIKNKKIGAVFREGFLKRIIGLTEGCFWGLDVREWGKDER
jgi:hypothetical protein